MIGAVDTKVIILVHCFWCVNGINIPRGFKFGVATASYQVEGGWNASGKGENIWDRLSHDHPEAITDHSTGDIACDSFHQWRRDIEILTELRIDYYRFSLSWSRILPTGFINKINQEGVNYYNDLINELLKNDIEPMVTLYHFDLPQPIQDLGGWTSSQTAEYFKEYARLVFSLFGGRVKKWITINEPSSICVDVYEYQNGAPDVKSPGIGTYICGKTLLLAHAKAYHIYDEHFRKRQNGKIGITIDTIWAEPKTNSIKDHEAAQREMQMSFGWWTHPIFSVSGGYPNVMETRIRNISRLENFTESRLPPLNHKDKKFIQGTADFLGLNHYHTWLISDYEYPIPAATSFRKDKGTKGVQDPNWKPSPQIVPWGIRKVLNWIRYEYNNPLVYITENGYGDTNKGLDDTIRVIFLKGFISSVMDALLQDGCNVKAYTVWSIMDNMEWRSGYTMKFGLYHVDFNSSERTRTPRASAKFYKNIIKSRRIDE